MLASTQPPTIAADWASEPKLDGWRALAYVEGAVRVRTRTGRDVTGNLPQLQGLAKLDRRVVLDGELVADAGRARDFYRLGGRVRSSGATGEVTFVAFDLLVLDGDSICDWSYRRRHAALQSLGVVGAAWCTIRSLDAEPRELLDACAELDVEGVVDKRVDTPYRPGSVRATDSS
jgi:bifunctional non-homologous end joining protein LigD